VKGFRRRRIAYVNHTGRVSGAEKVLLHMLRGMDRTAYESVVLCPAEGDLQRMVAAEGVPHVAIAELQARFTWRPDRLLRYLVSFVRVLGDLRGEIERLNPGIVHANTLRAGIATTVATIGTGRIVIWHVHDILPAHPISSIIRGLAYASSRTRVIAVSHATAAAFCGRLRFKERLRVIHNGTDLSRFPCKQRGASSLLKRELGLSDKSFLVCAVGQICARKGLLELLDAFAGIYRDAPDMHLAIVGRAVFSHEEQYRDALLERVRSAGLGDRVHFTGERRDITSVLQSANLLVLNSLQEPFGLVLVEAMSCGTPVLAARVGGIPEIVTDSVSGWLIEKGDTRRLGIKLLQLSQQPEVMERVATTAHDTVCPRFSLEQFLAKLDAFYADLPFRPDTQRGTQVSVSVHHEEGDQFV
jgi:L-malate glycosyltransferase